MDSASSDRSHERGRAARGLSGKGTVVLAGVVLAGVALAFGVLWQGGSSGPFGAMGPLAGGLPFGGEPPCVEPAGGHAAASVPSPDLYCIELHPAPAGGEARGRVWLLPAETPFGAAVDRDGVARHRFRLEAHGLPDPSELGDFDRYVVWITPPSLFPMVPVGEVHNGTFELGEAAFNQFIVMVSAEGPEPGAARAGPLVLRGTSASMQIRPRDLPVIIAEMAGGTGDPGAHDHGRHHEPPGAHAGHGMPAPPDVGGDVRIYLGHGLGEIDLPPGAASEWRMPPMHPLVQMPVEMMRMRPPVDPFIPVGGAAGASGDGAGHAGIGASIPLAQPRRELLLQDGDTLDLEAGPVLRRIGGLELPGYGFNGQIPGPLLRAQEGATVHVRFRNDTPLPTAIHWHGLRLENRFDGVPGLTQDPIPPGATFSYELRMPDEGTFWYHPHLREDVMQDLGLTGNIHVTPVGAGADGDDGNGSADGWYPAVHREAFLQLDDHLLGPDGPVAYGAQSPVHALMGRIGNVLLVNGATDWSTEVRPGEVVRFHLTNVANARAFNISFGGAPIRLVGGDVGRLPRSRPVESVVIAPAERWIVDVLFEEPGTLAIENRVQAIDHMSAIFLAEVDTLGIVRVEGTPAPPLDRPFDAVHEAPALAREVDALVVEHRGQPPERSLVLDVSVGELPFPLDPLLIWEGVFRPQVEWAGTMPDMDWLVSGREVGWVLRDPETGRENMAIDWRFRVGDQVRVRLVNDRDGLHAMQHPIHIHGQRFLVLAVNGEPHPDPTWKDTVLVPTGTTVDLLVEMSNPGSWMVHCHIAEHLETGMMAVFEVTP